MPVPMVCPQCQADFRVKEIESADQELFGGETHFSRVIGVYHNEADATVGWLCPDCRYTWAQVGALPFGLRTYELISLSSRFDKG
jgi:transposase-like protein